MDRFLWGSPSTFLMRYIIETENQEIIEHVMAWVKFQSARVMFDDGRKQVCHRSENEIAQAIELLLKEFAVKSQRVTVYRVLGLLWISQYVQCVVSSSTARVQRGQE